MNKDNKGRFVKGHTPWLKDKKVDKTKYPNIGFKKGNKIGNRFKKGVSYETSFKPGHKIQNTGRTRFKKGCVSLNKGKPGKISGLKHWNWKGGRSSLNVLIRNCFKSNAWKSDVFNRDDYTCQKCKKRGGNLHAHHKKDFSIILKENHITTLTQALFCDELWNLNNGITYCKKCHKELHKKRRRINNG